MEMTIYYVSTNLPRTSILYTDAVSIADEMNATINANGWVNKSQIEDFFADELKQIEESGVYQLHIVGEQVEIEE